MRGFITGVVVGVVALSAVAANGAQGPSVWLVKKSPATVTGTGFKAGRSVVVTYRTSAWRRQRTVTASASGQINAAFAGVTFARCGGVQIVAGAAELIVRSCSSPGGRPLLLATQSGLVSGSKFLPHERVQLLGRTSGQEPVLETVQAGATGSFVQRVPVKKLACAETFYRATGALGSTATYTVTAPECKAP
jgi:hypothetical protein